jgi:hypothetical protein
LKTNHKEIEKEGIKCYFSGRQKHTLDIKLDTNGRYFSFVNKDLIKDTRNKKDKWKLITPAAYGFVTKGEDTYDKIGDLFVASPNVVCTETYIFFDFDTELECNNMSNFLKTKFCEFLISLRKTKQDVTSKIFDIIPLLDMTKEWTSVSIYNYFNLTKEEITIIENNQVNKNI